MDVTISRWGVKIQNNLYLGKNLQPLRNYIANPSTGATYGLDGLYAGESFYATTEHIYNRTWVGYDRKFFHDTLHVEAGMVFHYDGTGMGTQQVVRFSVDIQRLLQHRAQTSRTQTRPLALIPYIFHTYLHRFLHVKQTHEKYGKRNQ